MTISVLSVRFLHVARGLAMEIAHGVSGHSQYVVTLRLTLILVILHGASSEYVAVPIRVLCATMLVFPTLVERKLLWWALTGALVVGNGRDWYLIDNHKYLITYWVLACALSLHQAHGPASLRVTARLIIGLVFAFASAWKLLGGGYLDGSFFEFTFLTDPRLRRVAAAITGSQVSDIAIIGEAYAFLGRYGAHGATMAMDAPSSSLRAVAISMSWFALTIEASVAIVHLTEAKYGRALRHVALVAFIAFTYFLLPVVAFAFVLTVLGFAQCGEDDTELKIGYLILLGWMQLALIPWQTLLIADI